MIGLGMHVDCAAKQVHRAREQGGAAAGTEVVQNRHDVWPPQQVSAVPQLPPASKDIPSFISTFIAQNPDLASAEIGTFPSFEHQIKLAPDAVPVAVKA